MTRIFDPTGGPTVPVGEYRRGDAAPPQGYVYDADGRIALAVEVALVTGRPLLVRGKPGTGKTSLAIDVASRLGWRFYRHTVTSRTRARDLLWTFDAVRRLNDANAHEVKAPMDYVRPGVLWWAFDPASAPGDDPSPSRGERAVVLIDEIDKADPDLPNDLLVPLGALYFDVHEIEQGPRVAATTSPLILITTNEERDLPVAFVRRCVVLTVPEADDARMLEVARAHFVGQPEMLLQQILDAYHSVRRGRAAEDHEPSLAEFLDAVAAVAALGEEDRHRWEGIVEFTLTKPGPA